MSIKPVGFVGGKPAERASQIVEANGHAVDATDFREALVAWGHAHFRPFPWRLTDDPYRILMAEVMLHRTQAVQVVATYERFTEWYPELALLAQATKEELRRVLSPLGLHWRVDMIYEMASDLMARFDGRVPWDKADLLCLPGVSDYIAGAVRCFAWNQAESLMDTNTVRVVGRVFGLEIKDSSRRNRLFRELIVTLLDPNEPRAYNYALLDLADQVCMKRRSPECPICPLRMYCAYGGEILAASNTSEGNRGPDG